jgi:glycosyltransferase involved in cell wall biosynthesis
MRVALVSEIFPPRAGGAGWSTRALALGLLRAGHEVRVITTSPGPEDLDGLDVRRLRIHGRKRLAAPKAFARAVSQLPPDVVVHAQHSLAALGCLSVRRDAHVVVTVRDHWPVCFWSTRISRGRPCLGCGWRPMTRCLLGHVRVPAPASWGLVPYMRWDLAVKRAALKRAGAVITVSEAVAREVRAAVRPDALVLPNIVDPNELEEAAHASPVFPLPERFLLFVGKLEANKGAHLLVSAVARARTGLPLVVLGEGSLAASMKHEALTADVPLLLRGWVHRRDVLAVLARATALVFPSVWDEPLSRVLLEALALGTPVAAVSTGGTREIVADGESGLLVDDAAGLTPVVERLVADEALRTRLAAGARARAQAFAPATLIPRYEAVYADVLRKAEGGGERRR